MYVIEPYIKHFEEELPAEQGDTPEFWRVFSSPMAPKGRTVSMEDNATWLADFATVALAEQFVSGLESTV